MTKCTRCKGSGYVPAQGGWTTEYDSDMCPQCRGTGEESRRGVKIFRIILGVLVVLFLLLTIYLAQSAVP